MQANFLWKLSYIFKLLWKLFMQWSFYANFIIQTGFLWKLFMYVSFLKTTFCIQFFYENLLIEKSLKLHSACKVSIKTYFVCKFSMTKNFPMQILYEKYIMKEIFLQQLHYASKFSTNTSVSMYVFFSITILLCNFLKQASLLWKRHYACKFFFIKELPCVSKFSMKLY